MKKNKILVTGAAGFLGSHLAEKLAGMGNQVVGVDNMQGGYADNVPKNIKFHKLDCCDIKKVNQIMEGVEIGTEEESDAGIKKSTLVLGFSSFIFLFQLN